MTERDDSLLVLGAAQFDRSTGRLVDADRSTIALPPQSTAILRALVDHADKDVAIDALVSVAGGSVAVTDEDLVQSIAEIRNALGDTAKTIIQTVPGIGYRLCTVPSEPVDRERNTLKYLGLAVAVLPVLAFIFVALLVAIGG